VAPWLKLSVHQQRFALTVDEPALQRAAQLDGCYVVETDLPAAQVSAQIIHDRYCALEEVERDFRALKTGHLEWRPWFVVTEENTQAHALTSMLALKVRRYLERAWWKLEVTVEEGLRELEELCVMELAHPGEWRAHRPSNTRAQLAPTTTAGRAGPSPAEHRAGSPRASRHAQKNPARAQNPCPIRMKWQF